MHWNLRCWLACHLAILEVSVRILKLILLLLKGMTGLETNFTRISLFSSRMGELPEVEAAETLNCEVDLLLITYLGILISDRQPHRQDWKRIILKVRKRLSSWKWRFLSKTPYTSQLGFIYAAMYWMSIFWLPTWVIKKIKHLRRDFLWYGPDIDYSTCRLVYWKNICRSRDQGGWGILDLYNFNQALLGKWWWKFMTDTNWCGSKVIQFNYRVSI